MTPLQTVSGPRKEDKAASSIKPESSGPSYVQRLQGEAVHTTTSSVTPQQLVPHVSGSARVNSKKQQLKFFASPTAGLLHQRPQAKTSPNPIGTIAVPMVESNMPAAQIGPVGRHEVHDAKNISSNLPSSRMESQVIKSTSSIPAPKQGYLGSRSITLLPPAFSSLQQAHLSPAALSNSESVFQVKMPIGKDVVSSHHSNQGLMLTEPKTLEQKTQRHLPNALHERSQATMSASNSDSPHQSSEGDTITLSNVKWNQASQKERTQFSNPRSSGNNKKLVLIAVPSDMTNQDIHVLQEMVAKLHIASENMGYVSTMSDSPRIHPIVTPQQTQELSAMQIEIGSTASRQKNATASRDKAPIHVKAPHRPQKNSKSRKQGKQEDDPSSNIPTSLPHFQLNRVSPMTASLSSRAQNRTMTSGPEPGQSDSMMEQFRDFCTPEQRDLSGTSQETPTARVSRVQEYVQVPSQKFHAQDTRSRVLSGTTGKADMSILANKRHMSTICTGHGFPTATRSQEMPVPRTQQQHISSKPMGIKNDNREKKCHIGHGESMSKSKQVAGTYQEMRSTHAMNPPVKAMENLATANLAQEIEAVDAPPLNASQHRENKKALPQLKVAKHFPAQSVHGFVAGLKSKERVGLKSAMSLVHKKSAPIPKSTPFTPSQSDQKKSMDNISKPSQASVVTRQPASQPASSVPPRSQDLPVVIQSHETSESLLQPGLPFSPDAQPGQTLQTPLSSCTVVNPASNSLPEEEMDLLAKADVFFTALERQDRTEAQRAQDDPSSNTEAQPHESSSIGFLSNLKQLRNALDHQRQSVASVASVATNTEDGNLIYDVPPQEVTNSTEGNGEQIPNSEPSDEVMTDDITPSLHVGDGSEAHQDGALSQPLQSSSGTGSRGDSSPSKVPHYSIYYSWAEMSPSQRRRRRKDILRRRHVPIGKRKLRNGNSQFVDRLMIKYRSFTSDEMIELDSMNPVGRKETRKVRKRQIAQRTRDHVRELLAFLEKENEKLRQKEALLEKENIRLRAMIAQCTHCSGPCEFTQDGNMGGGPEEHEPEVDVMEQDGWGGDGMDQSESDESDEEPQKGYATDLLLS